MILNSAQTIIGTTLKPTIVLDNKKNYIKIGVFQYLRYLQ